MLEGEIIIHSSDGSRFRGVIHDGKLNGAAIEESADGVRFEGSYRNDRRHGPFVERDQNGNITARGVYEDGVRHVEN